MPRAGPESQPFTGMLSPIDTDSVDIDECIDAVHANNGANPVSTPPPPPAGTPASRPRVVPPPPPRVVPPPVVKRPTQQPPTVQALGRFKGLVKSFNTRNGFGFIECAALSEQGFRDAFLHHTELSSVQPDTDIVGARVTFLAFLRNDKPQARYVEFDEDSLKDLKPPAKAKTPEQKDLGGFVGAVKSFSTAEGYGFLTSVKIRDQGYKGDVFVHKSQILDFEIGSAVSFSAYVDHKGRLKARDLKPVKSGNSTLEVGAVEVTRQSVEATAQGYLAVGAGAEVKVLYVGNSDNDDEAGWLFAKNCLHDESGWLPRSAIATHPSAN